MASRFPEDIAEDNGSRPSGCVELSIIIVNWNSKDYLLRAIASIETQTKDILFEILVIDSGSFDGCAEALRDAYPRVRFTQSADNIGFAKANNDAFKMSSGKTLLFLNPDTEIKGSAIETLHRYLRSSSDVGIVGPKLLTTDGSVDGASIRAFPTILNQLLESDALRRLLPGSALWGARSLGSSVAQEVDAVSGACLMVRRELFERVGLFTSDYFMYSEDIDLCLKARRAGYSTHYVPSAVVVHHGGGSSSRVEVSTFSTVMMLESRWRFFKRMRSPFYAALYRIAMLCSSVVRIVAVAATWPINTLNGKRVRTDRVLRKWRAGLRWTLGREAWVKRY